MALLNCHRMFLWLQIAIACTGGARKEGLDGLDDWLFWKNRSSLALAERLSSESLEKGIFLCTLAWASNLDACLCLLESLVGLINSTGRALRFAPSFIAMRPIFAEI